MHAVHFPFVLLRGLDCAVKSLNVFFMKYFFLEGIQIISQLIQTEHDLGINFFHGAANEYDHGIIRIFLAEHFFQMSDVAFILLDGIIKGKGFIFRYCFQ